MITISASIAANRVSINDQDKYRIAKWPPADLSKDPIDT